MIKEIWQENREACIAVLSDSLFFITCLASLSVMNVVFEWLPLSFEQKAAFERLDFFALYACVIVFVAQTFIHIVIHLVGRVQDVHQNRRYRQ